MTGLRARLAGMAERLDWPGVFGLGLLAFCAAFYLSTVRPGQQRVEQMLAEIETLVDRHTRLEDNAAPRTAREQLGAFYDFFPPAGRTASSLAKIFAVAGKQALVLEAGEYRLRQERAGAMAHYELVFPVQGTYPQIRKFAAAVLRQLPNVSLDSIRFERQKVGDGRVSARVKFVMYLGRAS